MTIPSLHIRSGGGVVTTTFSELPNWSFWSKAIGGGLYEVSGADGAGRRVAFRAADSAAALQACREAAARMMLAEAATKRLAGALADERRAPRGGERSPRPPLLSVLRRS
jgi:hypothetical protein